MPYKQVPEAFCDVLAKDKYIYPDVAKHSDFPEDIERNCPLPAVNNYWFLSLQLTKSIFFYFKGNYSFNGLSTKLENAPIVIAQSGEYAAELIYYKGDLKVAIYRGFAYINNV